MPKVCGCESHLAQPFRIPAREYIVQMKFLSGVLRRDACRCSSAVEPDVANVEVEGASPFTCFMRT